MANRRQKSPRQRGKAGRGGKGSQKSGPVGEAPAANGPTTKGLKEQLPAPPALQTPSLPVTPTGPASSHADPGLQQLLQALAQNRDDLPPGVRDLLDSQKEVDSRAHAKNLHKLVAAQGAARRQLAQARSGRQDYMREWAQYVSDICKIWEVQLDEKNKALQTFQDAEEQWERQLNESTQQIARLATETEGTQAIDVDSMSDQDAQEAQDAHINELARQEVAIDVDSMSDQDAQEAQDAHINELARQEARAAAESQVHALPKSERERSPRRRVPLDVKDTKEPKDKDKPGADGAKPGEASQAGAAVVSELGLETNLVLDRRQWQSGDDWSSITCKWVRIVPEELRAGPLFTAPVYQYSWGVQANRAANTAFTVFDHHRHVLVERCAPFASLQDIAALAINDAPFQVGAVKVLADPLPAYPTPQIVLSELGRPLDELPIPWDLRPIGEPVKTVRHLSRQDRQDALLDVQQLLTSPRNFAQEVAVGAIVVTDALGVLQPQLPANLHVVQHYRVAAMPVGEVPAYVWPCYGEP
eukprot:s642_g11.t1